MKVLKSYGATPGDLKAFYCAVIRSTLEYGSVVWHGNLTTQLSNDTERTQKRSLRIIYQECDYDRVLERANLSTLFQRREDSCVQPITKMLDPAHKLHHLLPPRLSDLHHDRNTRSDSSQIYNYKFKTERFKNSPIVYAISRFNLSVRKSFIRL